MRWLGAAAALFGAATGAGPVVAAEAPSIDDAAVHAAATRLLATLDYRYQEQLTVTRGGALPSGRLGLLEVAAAVSFWSIGVSAAVGFERVPDADLVGGDPHGAALGGYGHMAAEWRPVALSHARILGVRAFHWLDPQLALGARLGGLRDHDQTVLRAAMTLGGGLDIGWALHDVHPVITLRYRADVLTAPIRREESDATLGTPEHFILFGVGIRNAD